MKPYWTFFRDDLEDTPLGAPPWRWAAAGYGEVCVEHRGSHWAALPSPCAPLIVAGPTAFDRLEFDLELPADPPPDMSFVLQAASRFGLRVYVGQDGQYRLRFSGEECDLPGPSDGPHHVEITRVSASETYHYWDGALMLTLGAPPTYGSLFAVLWAPGRRVLLDNLRCSTMVAGGVGLVRDGQTIALCAGDQCCSSLDPPGFASRVTSSVWNRPSCADLPSGARLIASEAGAGIALSHAPALLPPSPEGAVIMLSGHRCPALCLLPERGEALLVTWLDGALHLTRGAVGAASVSWGATDPAPVVGEDAAEATAGLCALPDGRLLLCYQDTRCELHALTSSDDGWTWDRAPD